MSGKPTRGTSDDGHILPFSDSSGATFVFICDLVRIPVTELQWRQQWAAPAPSPHNHFCCGLAHLCEPLGQGSSAIHCKRSGHGAFNPAVTWLVNNVPGGNSSVGTIASSGLYTAPSSLPSPNSVTVVAQSVQDSTKSGAAAVTINPENVKVTVSPSSGSAQLGSTLQFTATVTGTVNTAVFWSVNNFPSGSSFLGFIDGNGNYTAPANLPGSNPVTVTATSQEDTSKSASATLTILATAGGITVSISPQNPSVVFDGSQSIQFTASVTGTSNTAVTWSLDTFSFPNIGQISQTGLFTPLAFNCTNVSPTGAFARFPQPIQAPKP